MTHTLTYHSIQNVQLHHHHIGRGIGPYPPSQANVPTNAHAHANATAPHRTHLKCFHVPQENGQCHLKLGPHMSCLCVHDVSHPCTRTCCIVRWAPTMSPAYSECHPQNDNPVEVESFMDDLVKSNPRPLHQD
ncbi:hypothetical protein O181_015642 [Austropuccinia psidii MF-1]|uniref:Uncharacterized protein n=1 Tax=Austropuccinia psidii MF-1 TaxID=1389203 RepID=A0A9Q3C2H5_9BASI|nr:hypothetical protein [Austropuccinia psidii MF-1]